MAIHYSLVTTVILPPHASAGIFDDMAKQQKPRFKTGDRVRWRVSPDHGVGQIAIVPKTISRGQLFKGQHVYGVDFLACRGTICSHRVPDAQLELAKAAKAGK